MRQLGERADTPAAKKKQRIGGAVLFAGIALNLVATLLPPIPANRPLAMVLFSAGTLCLLLAIVYMVTARRAS